MPIKGAIYFVLYWLVTVFAARLLALLKSDFVINNGDFFAYLFLAIVGVGLFYRFFLQSVKNIGKNLKENVKKALLIWAIAFLLMVAAVIIIALCKIENENQNAIDESSMNAVAIIYDKTKNILYPLALHIIYNLIFGVLISKVGALLFLGSPCEEGQPRKG